MLAPALRALVIAVVLLVCSCGGGPATSGAPDAPPAPPPEPATPQRPPRTGMADMEAWLAEGHHQSWRCEPVISPPRHNGTHGRHRICSNELLLASTSGSYPAGAASVKELFDASDAPRGFAVGLKVVEGAGAHTWYWYEGQRGPAGVRVVAQGIGVPDCAVCHGGPGARDYVFFRAAP